MGKTDALSKSTWQIPLLDSSDIAATLAVAIDDWMYGKEPVVHAFKNAFAG